MTVGEVRFVTRLADVPAVGSGMSTALATMGIVTIGQLLAHLPSRYEWVQGEKKIAELALDEAAAARGLVTATSRSRPGRTPAFSAVLKDDSGRLDVTWFNMQHVANKVHPGVRVIVEGKVARFEGNRRMVNPRLTVLPQDKEEPPEQQARLVPIYPASEGIASRAIERVVGIVLPLAMPLIDDHLPADFVRERGMLTRADAYRMLHTPANDEEPAAARRRLAYDEFLLLQLAVQMKRAHLRRGTHAFPLAHSDEIDRRIRRLLPFDLTAAQDRAIASIVPDLTRDVPTNRLIQGDVGSGKTVVALYAMLMCVAAGKQAALMAPTEVLAEQHAATLSAFLASTKVRVELLTGSMDKHEREAAEARITKGEAGIVVGTHALIASGPRFGALALAVIDEQHRFGVHQRAALRAKGASRSRDAFGIGYVDTTPHVVVMTATPIPRSLALTLFGDLDITTIDALPPGRGGIRTTVHANAERARVYTDLAARLRAGEKAYIVAPSIDSEEIASVSALAEELGLGPLAGLRVEALHARLSKPVRDAIMHEFRAGKIRALVSTTVIEVGVDVPDATIMVIENADRFGLAQLHQLRGRIGRGVRDSHCFLIADPTTDEACRRLDAIASTRDGFRLAEIDFEIRGPGEMFGTRQSGLPPFKVADLTRDLDLLRLAARDAEAWIARSPKLDRPEDARLRKRLIRKYSGTMGLGDVG